MTLTDRDLEVLADLRAANDSKYASHYASVWVRPMDCGGSNGSDHSYRLNKLVRLGFAEAQLRTSWTGSRGSKEYRITDVGREALAK